MLIMFHLTISRDSDQSLPSDHIRNLRLDTKVVFLFSFADKGVEKIPRARFQVAALACDQLREDGPLKTVFRSSSFLEVRLLGAE